jgi:hypothetical protein
VSAFVAACGNGSAAQCDTWLSANGACAACINPPVDSGAGENSGALLTDAVGQQFLNVAACVQIVDGNTGCAAPLQELTLCELDACDSAACQSATGADFNNCVTAADNLACASQLTAANNGCGGADSADGGAFTVCNENTPTGLEAVIYEICGNGM